VVIGVVCDESRRPIVAEFFELFKTPWEPYVSGKPYDVLLVCGRDPLPSADAKLAVVFGPGDRREDHQLGIRCTGSRMSHVEIGTVRLPIYGECVGFRASNGEDDEGDESRAIVVLKRSTPPAHVVRCGYALFAEVEHLLSSGQPTENAHVPTLDLHIDLLRRWITDAGVPLVEVPPTPPGYDFIVCLTHDIDFLDLRRHGIDRTALGFLYRATAGSARDLFARRSSLRRVLRNWRAAAAWPLVHLGLARDPWSPFEQYLAAERDLRSTFFVIPFRGRAGQHVPTSRPSRRAAPYDLDDIREPLRRLADVGFEIGVHGIDAWNSEVRAREELARIAEITGEEQLGIRMHWLLFDQGSAARLDRAGFVYDSTFGYNDEVGFRAGTAQPFRPHSVSRLLELPLHIQDTALFFPQRLHLTETEAWQRCERIWQPVEAYGGALTILWHERSLAPERQWGEFYARLLETLRLKRTWFGTGREVTRWFTRRRAVTMDNPTFDGGTVRVWVNDQLGGPDPAPAVRIHMPGSEAGRTYLDVPFHGRQMVEVDIEQACAT
jgi:hypothetical protein